LRWLLWGGFRWRNFHKNWGAWGQRGRGRTVWSAGGGFLVGFGDKIPHFCGGKVFDGFEIGPWAETAFSADDAGFWPCKSGFHEEFGGFPQERFNSQFNGYRFLGSGGMRGDEEPQSAAVNGSSAEGFEIFGRLVESVFPEVLKGVNFCAVEMVYAGGCVENLVLLGGPDLLIGDGYGFGFPTEIVQITIGADGQDFKVVDLGSWAFEKNLEGRGWGFAAELEAVFVEVGLGKFQTVFEEGFLEVDLDAWFGCPAAGDDETDAEMGRGF